MEKLWAGAAHGALDAAADSFNSSIGVDARMYREDIRGSMAHAAMLAKCGIVSAEEGAQLIAGLGGILADLESGTLAIDPAAEDIHSFVEATLTARLGDVGKSCTPPAAATTRWRWTRASTCARRPERPWGS